jgi:hypothetical protein
LLPLGSKYSGTNKGVEKIRREKIAKNVSQEQTMQNLEIEYKNKSRFLSPAWITGGESAISASW